MSKDNFDALKPEMDAIPDNDVKTPNMPVDKAVQEAADLVVWSKEDQPKLEAVGVPSASFTRLPVAEGALRYAQSVWNKERYSHEEATRQWNAEAPVADDLRNEL